jgi:hypothetical protein
MKMTSIIGRIAKALSKSVVVINRGRKDGVHEGMEFDIYEEGDEVIDPDTKESLGKLEIVKGRVSVESVQESLSIAKAATRTEQRERWLESPLTGLGAVHSLQELYGRRRVIENVVVPENIEIDVKEDRYSGRLIVRVGDFVRSVDS